MVYNSLVRILKEVNEPQISLQKLNEKFDEFESVISQVGDSPNTLEVTKILEILFEIGKKSNSFYEKWKDEKKISPSDEELKCLEKILDNLSNWYRGMAKTSLRVRAEEPEIQKRIKEIKGDIAEEKKKREQQNNTSTETEEKLKVIYERVKNQEISLLKTKEAYDDLSNIINNSASLTPEEGILGLEIVRKISGRIVIFYTEWNNTKKIQPSKEELDLLEEISDKISNSYKGMMNSSGSQSIAEEEKYIQDKINQIKVAISKERAKGSDDSSDKPKKNSSEDDDEKTQQEVDDLESSIKVLRNSINDGNDGNDKIKKTKEKLGELESQLRDLKDKQDNGKKKDKLRDTKDEETGLEKVGKVMGVILVVFLIALLIIWLARKIFVSK